MLVSLFRKCCRILWSHLSYQQHIIWLFLLVLLSQQLQGSDGKPTKWNRSIQRRFMWKQMDSTVDGFVDRVVTGARVMKSMIGDFMPPKQNSGNVMDYLPTETTRIRYIIRNPLTKETKVIRVRPSKKVVKLMAMTPKPMLADKPKQINAPEPMADKVKPMPLKEPEYTTEKFRSVYMMDPDQLRQLEKEQELIAEGRIPIKSETKPIYMAYKSEKPKYYYNYFNNDDNTVSGRIQEMNESWKPVYKLGDPPAGFTTSKPYMMSALHTSVVGELLPEPQKQVYEPLTSNDFPEEEPKKSHTYEVTEYTAEESIVQPYTHAYYSHQRPTALPANHHVDTSPKYFAVTTDPPSNVAQTEEGSAHKSYHSEYRSQRGFLPSRGSYRLSGETTTTTTSASITTTTTEEPNYPAIFLKKLRSQPDITYNSKEQHRNKSQEISFENNWLPSNSSQRGRQIPYQLTSISSPQRIKSQKWPPDAENIYLSPEPLDPYDVHSTTEVPVLLEFTTQTTLSQSDSRKNVRLKSPPHYSSFTEAKHKSVRHRGSVKFGDKLEIEER